MGGCRCSYKNCKNTTKTTDNMHFFHYPVKQRERCIKWIENACKPNFFELEEEQLRNKVVCEAHFEDKWFPNMQKKRLIQGAIPTLDGDCVVEQPTIEETLYINVPDPGIDIKVLPANDEGTVFVLDTENMYPRQPKVESYMIKNGVLIPTNSNSLVKPDTSLPNKYVTNAKASTSTVSEPVYASEMELDHIRQPNFVIESSEGMVQNLYKEIKREVPESPEVAPHTHSSSKHILNMDYIINDAPEAISYTLSDGQEAKINCDIKSNGVQSKRTPPAHRPSTQKNFVGKKYMRKINQHSRDIATIKRMLKQQQKPDAKVILNTLRDKIPPSLHTILGLLLGEKQDLDEDDIEFFTTLHRVSPYMYEVLSDKYEWNLPDPE